MLVVRADVHAKKVAAGQGRGEHAGLGVHAAAKVCLAVCNAERNKKKKVQNLHIISDPAIFLLP